MVIHGGSNFIDLKGVALSGTSATVAGLHKRIQKAVATGKTVTVGNFVVSGATVPPAIASVKLDSTSYVLTTEDFVITVSSANAVTATANSGGGSTYVLPPATASVLGGVKVGSGLSVTEEGVLSATGGGGGSDIFVVPSDTVFTVDAEDSTKFTATVAGISNAITSGKPIYFDKVAINYGGYGQYYPFSGFPAIHHQMAGPELYLVGGMEEDQTADAYVDLVWLKVYVSGSDNLTAYYRNKRVSVATSN